MNAAIAHGLRTAKRMYLTTYSTSGRSGTVPTWFMVKDGVLYSTTLRASLKARRIKATGRVRGAGLAFLQVAQAQVEADDGVAGRAGPGALERGQRLIEGAELVAGNPEVHEGVEPVRILGEYPLEGAGRVGVASFARGRDPLAERRATAGEHGEREHET